MEVALGFAAEHRRLYDLAREWEREIYSSVIQERMVDRKILRCSRELLKAPKEGFGRLEDLERSCEEEGRDAWGKMKDCRVEFRRRVSTQQGGTRTTLATPTGTNYDPIFFCPCQDMLVDVLLAIL
eukprot:1364427-Amorphochlora_amoeboformis.AAC.2